AGLQPVDPAVELEVEHARGEQDALVLALVILERERLAPVDVQDLAQIPVGDGPAKLVPPGFVDLAIGGPSEGRPALRSQRSPPEPLAWPRPPRGWRLR